MLRMTLIAAVLLTGCGIAHSQRAADARSQLVGRSQEQILVCMGPPENQAAIGETEVWRYFSGGSVRAGNLAYCNVDVTITGGKVQSVRYSGPSGSAPETRYVECYHAVAGCIGEG
jgi:hypothetical protein